MLTQRRKGRDRDLPAAVVLRRLDQLLAGGRVRRNQPVSPGELLHVLRVREIREELHRLRLVRALRRDRVRLRIGQLILGRALEQRQQRPVEAGRRRLDHLLSGVVALDRHRVLTREEARKHTAAARTDRGRVDAAVVPDHVVHGREVRRFALPDLDDPLACRLVEVEERAAPVQRHAERDRRRGLEAPADAELTAAGELLRGRAELRPRPRVGGRRQFDSGSLEGVDVREDVVGLQQRRHRGDLAAVRDRVPHTLRDARLQARGDQLAQIREIALLREAGEIGGLVVDDVRRGATREVRDDVVVHGVRVDLDLVHVNVRMARVPGGDDLLRRRNGGRLPHVRHEVDRDRLAGPGLRRGSRDGQHCTCEHCTHSAQSASSFDPTPFAWGHHWVDVVDG